MVEDNLKLSGDDQRCAKMELVLRDQKNLVCTWTERERVGNDPVPLCTLLLGVSSAGCSLKWVLKKVQEIQECLTVCGFLVRDLKPSLEPYLLPLKRTITRL